MPEEEDEEEEEEEEEEQQQQQQQDKASCFLNFGTRSRWWSASRSSRFTSEELLVRWAPGPVCILWLREKTFPAPARKRPTVIQPVAKTLY
jgi:hypothetical protein